MEMKVYSLIDYLRNPRKLILRLGRYSFLKLVSDEKYLKLKFKANLGRTLNLDAPQTFNEKLQWLKINDRNPLYTTLVDKYAVRKYIAETIGAEYLIPLVGGPWDSFSDIDIDALPNQFVLKCTHDSGGLVVCRDKSMLDFKALKKNIESSLKRNYYWAGREWPYKNVKPRIIAEKYMEDGNQKGLTDYKYFCFSGEPFFMYISQGLEDHATAEISFYDLEWEALPFTRNDFRPIKQAPNRPSYYKEMESIAKCLSRKISAPFVRIDLYSISGHIYFSECTFFPCGGMLPFSDLEWDKRLGNLIKI